MSDENFRDGKFESPLIIDVGRAIMEFGRADVIGPAAPCVYCKLPTNRVLVFRSRIEVQPRMVRSCDGCHDAIRKVAAKEGEKPGILKGV